MEIRSNFINRRTIEEITDEDVKGKLKQNAIVVRELSHSISYGGLSLKTIPDLIKKIIREEMWRKRINDIEVLEFDSFEEFITTDVPEGLGATIDQIKALCAGDNNVISLIDQEITRKPGAPVGNQFASKEEKTNHDNVMNSLSDTKASQGNSVEYTLRRLRKDHPELHEKVLANEMSPNAAAIEAGFRKRTWTAPSDVNELIEAITKRFTPDELNTITTALTAQAKDNE